jgi:hypothetical protein
MDEERIIIALPEIDRKTFEATLCAMERTTAQMQRCESRDRIISDLAEMRNRLKDKA